MFNLTLSRKNLFAIFLGFLVTLLLGAIISAISFFLNFWVVRSVPSPVSPQSFEAAFSQQPLATFFLILKILSFLSLVLGGGVVGWLIKEKGWLYGGLLGLIQKFISIGIVLLAFLLPMSLIYGQNFPVSFRNNLLQKSLLKQVANAPRDIALTAFGGWLGEKLHKSRKKLSLSNLRG